MQLNAYAYGLNLVVVEHSCPVIAGLRGRLL